MYTVSPEYQSYGNFSNLITFSHIRYQELLRGNLVIESTGISYTGISVFFEGAVSLQLSAKNVGIFEAFYNSIKPVQLINASLELRKSGKLTSGRVMIPFELPLKANPGQKLYESYHGVFINIQYLLRIEVHRSTFSKDLSAKTEIFIEALGGNAENKPIFLMQNPFAISPKSLANFASPELIPDFLIEGEIDSLNCEISQPFSGKLLVKNMPIPIKTIELQLIRVETCGCAEGFATDPTEIQNIQIADGDVVRNFEIPIHMMFPRLFTCPTLKTDNFRIEFEVNIVIILTDRNVISQNFPITLYRRVV
eukprot:gene1277-4484_t